MKFLLASMKSLTNRENPSGGLFRKPAMNVHWRNSTNQREGLSEQKFDAAYGTIFRISKCFQRSKQKLYIYFSAEQPRLKD
jgi:hypothetical protein